MTQKEPRLIYLLLRIVMYLMKAYTMERILGTGLVITAAFAVHYDGRDHVLAHLQSLVGFDSSILTLWMLVSGLILIFIGKTDIAGLTVLSLPMLIYTIAVIDFAFKNDLPPMQAVKDFVIVSIVFREYFVRLAVKLSKIAALNRGK